MGAGRMRRSWVGVLPVCGAIVAMMPLSGGRALAGCGHCCWGQPVQKEVSSSSKPAAGPTKPQHAHAACCWQVAKATRVAGHPQGCWGGLFSSAKVEATNTDEGVVIKVTSEDAKVRQRLQEHWRQFAGVSGQHFPCFCPHCGSHGKTSAEGKPHVCPWCPQTARPEGNP